MSKPLIISDCDEVLLYMVAPFKAWLEEGEGVTFNLKGNDFANALRWDKTGELVEPMDMWKFLRRFFDDEMHRQSPIPGAVEGMNRLAEEADVVVLTNLEDKHQESRTEQLAEVGINARVFTNQGPKGPALEKILAEYQPSTSIFIDDLAQHHKSAMEVVPHLGRLHLCAEPMISPHIDCAHEAGHADARIDNWAEALPWLLNQIEGAAA